MVRKKTELELQELIKKVIYSVTKDFNIDEIILFGSYAKDTANELSEVDFEKLKKQEKPFIAKIEKGRRT